MNEIILQNKDGQILASSREVAEKFRKRHTHVLDAIKGFEKELSTAEFSALFKSSEYIASNGKRNNEFLMNRDGFSLLAMGFTGKKALEWKLKYIEAFNKMEEKLKLGDYLSEEEKLKLQLFSKDPLEVASAHKRLVEFATAPLIAENNRKQEIINGFTDEVPIYEKPDIINRICKKSYGGYANRYKELYKCFRENYHIDLIKRCENYNAEQLKRKDELTIIRYAEKFGFIENLYSCCVKLYETEVKEIIEELNELHN